MDREWMLHAACRDTDTPDLFFPDKPGVHGQKQAAMAAAICRSCPVIADCAAYREATGSPWGVWAGDVVRDKHHSAYRRETPQHGTEAMYKRHVRLGETPCRACRAASSARRRMQKEAS